MKGWGKIYLRCCFTVSKAIIPRKKILEKITYGMERLLEHIEHLTWLALYSKKITQIAKKQNRKQLIFLL